MKYVNESGDVDNGMECNECGGKKKIFYSSVFGFLCSDCYKQRCRNQAIDRVHEYGEGLALGDTGSLTQEDMNDRP